MPTNDQATTTMRETFCVRKFASEADKAAGAPPYETTTTTVETTIDNETGEQISRQVISEETEPPV